VVKEKREMNQFTSSKKMEAHIELKRGPKEMLKSKENLNLMHLSN
jgi:hypothetical protein